MDDVTLNHNHAGLLQADLAPIPQYPDIVMALSLLGQPGCYRWFLFIPDSTNAEGSLATYPKPDASRTSTSISTLFRRPSARLRS
ncbi:hypothetical protein OE88DRAFT_1740540 [Heliocybe sulcata]|uniref:Uncharacterized protein n=1 Tax=Heliocybe sulcata TaxID=5364 RepID=A0A5C3MKH2_9AGAM|nr:hypothetical protein OE88DRAFT_1740540 [Heliocybe sulcata]